MKTGISEPPVSPHPGPLPRGEGEKQTVPGLSNRHRSGPLAPLELKDLHKEYELGQSPLPWGERVRVRGNIRTLFNIIPADSPQTFRNISSVILSSYSLTITIIAPKFQQRIRKIPQKFNHRSALISREILGIFVLSNYVNGSFEGCHRISVC